MNVCGWGRRVGRGPVITLDGFFRGADRLRDLAQTKFPRELFFKVIGSDEVGGLWTTVHCRSRGAYSENRFSFNARGVRTRALPLKSKRSPRACVRSHQDSTLATGRKSAAKCEW